MLWLELACSILTMCANILMIMILGRECATCQNTPFDSQPLVRTKNTIDCIMAILNSQIGQTPSMGRPHSPEFGIFIDFRKSGSV